MGGLIDFFRKGPYEFLVGCLIIFVSSVVITPWLNVSPNLQVINFGMNKTLGNGNGLQAMNAAVEANLRMNIQF